MIYGHEGVSNHSPSDIDITVHFILPDNTESTFSFTLDTDRNSSGDSCLTATLVAPAFTSSITYQVGDSTNRYYYFPAWTTPTTDSSGNACPIDYYPTYEILSNPLTGTEDLGIFGYWIDSS